MKMLFNRESECLQPLLSLIEKQNHRVLVMWALEYAEELATKFEGKYPAESHPREAVDTCRAWSQGIVKMPVAKKAIHAAHNAATEVADDVVYCAIARAVGQAVSTVHVETHAIGGPIYGLTAVVYESGEANAQAAVAEECDRLYQRLLYWEANIGTIQTPWAAFLLREDVPNKEKLLRERKEQMVALKDAQAAFSGEAERADQITEQDIVDMVKEVRREIWEEKNRADE